MDFPDQSHIDHVVEALWSHETARASVMVGAGFSQNAVSNADSTIDVPNWSDIAWAMHKKLYGKDRDYLARHKREMSADRSLALAQEYEVAFGRADLHRFLKNQINDETLYPGPAHTRLLVLPWKEVFTTNWDTLLERASELVTLRPYGVLRNAQELPIADEPRIVKLHGSLPAHFPLVVTEEDYRKYPRRFSPLVNTVQQAMMETTMLLLGFSGRDPNFLQWSGWVRDQLGSSAPKIYLAGWLALHPHHRRVLEDRNVVPIDLANHPKAAHWKRIGQHHQYATEWILRTLEQGKPYSPHEWPTPPHAPKESPPNLLEPVSRTLSSVPIAEPAQPEDDSDIDAHQLLEIWRHNRRLYPGWLSVPKIDQLKISASTSMWQDVILEAIVDRPLPARIAALHEIVWRRKVLLEGLHPAIADATQDALVQAAEQSTKGPEPTDNLSGNHLDIDAIRCLCSQLLTYARFQLNERQFEQVSALAQDFAAHDVELDHIVRHERCLWALFAMDFDTLRTHLDEWPTNHGDAYWNVRKAALMLEAGVEGGVQETVRNAIVEFRNRRKAGNVLSNVSREAWASFFMDHFEEDSIPWHRPRTPEDLARYARYRCDALNEMIGYRQALHPEPGEQHEVAFDLDVERSETVTLHTSGYEVWGTDSRRLVAAVQAIRLSEVLGLPPVVKYWAVTREVIVQAAKELYATQPELAIRLMLRVVRYDGSKLIKLLVSRTSVARLETSVVTSLLDICDRIIEQSLPPFVSVPKLGGVPRIERLRVAVEVRSRLSLRLSEDRAKESFEHTMQLYSERSISGHPWMADPLKSAMSRTWQALRPAQRSELMLKVLGSPIQGVDGFPDGGPRFPDPAVVVLGQGRLDVPARDTTNESEWQSVLTFLVRALRTEGEARKCAAARLAHIAIWDRFSEREAADVADALWSIHDDHGLPSDTALNDWVFLILPQPNPEAARTAFTRRWLSCQDVASLSGEDLDAALWALGDAKACEQIYQYALTYSEDELKYIQELIARWSLMPIPPRMPFFDTTRNRTFRAAVGCAELLMHVTVPAATMNLLVEKLNALNAAEIPPFALVPPLMTKLPAKREEIVSEMRNALASDGRRAKQAARALFAWLHRSEKSGWELPPRDLIREAGVIVRTRRKPALADALRVFAWVFTHGRPELRAELKQLVVEGLEYLLQDLDYENDDIPTDLDIPLIRWRCAALAVAMRDAGEDNEIVYAWIHESENDPMPEVRFAEDEIRIIGTSRR